MTRRGAVIVAAHPGTELALWLQAGRARAAVVRPDRTVLCAGRQSGRSLPLQYRFSRHPPIPALMR